MQCKKKKVYIFVNGILAYPGNSQGWTDRAVTWTHLNSGCRGEKFEYFAGALSRRLFQQSRAKNLARLVVDYQSEGWQVCIVGHSNGCDVIIRALSLMPLVHLEEVHLISAACEEDPEVNGLKEKTLKKLIKKVQVFVAGKDKALGFARRTRKILEKFGLGYGSLGVDIKYVEKHYDDVVFEPNYDHSDWFEDDNFDKTMSHIIKKVA